MDGYALATIPAAGMQVLELQELGLDRVGAAQALRETGGQSVAAAADWYFTNYKQDRQPERRADDVSWLFS